MPVYEFEGRSPDIDPNAFVAPTAVLIGDVRVEAGASVWYNAVLRADWGPIHIGADANVQDCAVVHSTPMNGTTIGPRVTIGHSCVVHGATIEEGALIGNSATILDGVVIRQNTLVAAGAVVTPGTEIAGDSLAAGSPAKVVRSIAGSPMSEMLVRNGTAYVDLARRHAAMHAEAD